MKNNGNLPVFTDIYRMGRVVLPLLFLFCAGLTYAQEDTSPHTTQAVDKDFHLAERYFFERKFEVAAAYLKKVLEAKPDHSQAASLLGDVYLFYGDYEAALRMHRRAAEISPRPGLEYYRMGQDALALKQSSLAAEYFQKAYDLEPSLNQCLFQLGYIELVYERNKDKTIFYWRRFLAADPQDAQADRIEEVLALLEDPNFVLPGKDSGVSLEEVLRLGGKLFEAQQLKPKDETAGHLDEKTINEGKELPDDDGL